MSTRSARYFNILILPSCSFLRVWTRKTSSEQTKRCKQQQEANTGLNHEAPEININSKAISFSWSDPKGNTRDLSFLFLPKLRMGRNMQIEQVHTGQKSKRQRPKASSTPLTGLIKPLAATGGLEITRTFVSLLVFLQ